MADGLARELYKDYELSSYYPSYVRRLTGLSGDRRYFVIPAFGRPEAVPPAHWFPGNERRELVKQEHRRSVEPVYCIIEVGGNRKAPVPGCALRPGRRKLPGLPRQRLLGGEPTIELVPDGVASMRIAYLATAPIVVHVSENAFVLTPPPTPNTPLDTELRQLLHRLFDKHLTRAQRLRITIEYNNAFTGTNPTRIEWFNSTGGPVRAISPPTAESNSATSAWIHRVVPWVLSGGES